MSMGTGMAIEWCNVSGCRRRRRRTRRARARGTRIDDEVGPDDDDDVHTTRTHTPVCVCVCVWCVSRTHGRRLPRRRVVVVAATVVVDMRSRGLSQLAQKEENGGGGVTRCVCVARARGAGARLATNAASASSRRHFLSRAPPRQVGAHDGRAGDDAGRAQGAPLHLQQGPPGETMPWHDTACDGMTRHAMA